MMYIGICTDIDVLHKNVLAFEGHICCWHICGNTMVKTV